MIPKDRAQRDEEVGFGFTSIGVTVKKLGGVFYEGPICKKNLYKLGLDRKTESVLYRIRLRLRENAFSAETERNTLSEKIKRTLAAGEGKNAF